MIKATLKKIFGMISRRIWLEAVLIGFSLWMGYHFAWEISNLIFFILFVLVLLHPISSRIPAGAVIIFLVSTAVLLVAKQSDLAETAAIWAYYAMIFTATMAGFELSGKGDDDILAEKS